MQTERWTAWTSDVAGGLRYEIREQDKAISFRCLLDLLAGDDGFSRWYTSRLAGCPYRAFYWENPPITTDSLDRAAEFVLMDAPALARMRPDPDAFRSHFAGSPRSKVVTFPNLGGDALLIAPAPEGPLEAYTHLAAFVRAGPSEQIHHLWQVVARVVRERLESAPMWLSTSGAGVGWLHVRFDRRPKYYQYEPYRCIDQGEESWAR